MLEAYIILLLIVTTLLVFHGTLSLWQMLKGWSSPQLMNKNTMPTTTKNANTYFSVIIPARHEENVIKETLEQLIKQTYPKDKYEILVSMASDDLLTIAKVEEVIYNHPKENIKIVVFGTGPINKPHGLNAALTNALGDYIAIFDAEDHVHPHLLASIDTAINTSGRKIIQTGVNLINWNSSWFGIHATLEYYFWFKSRIQWYAEKGIVTLGGVGAFIPKEVLIVLNGWDENCLTEDAKLGVDCTIKGYTFKVISDEKYATAEEVPTKLFCFVKQRTRWIQGYLQIVGSGNWLKLSVSKQILFLSLFMFPIFQSILLLWFVSSIFMFKHLPVAITMISFLPLFILLFQIVIHLAGLIEMLKSRRQLKMAPLAIVQFIIGYLPYQIVIGFCAVRALTRSITGNYKWEKTTHLNIHREGTLQIISQDI